MAGGDATVYGKLVKSVFQSPKQNGSNGQRSTTITVTRPGIFVPTEVREILIEEGIENANAEVQAGGDRNVFAAD